MSCCVPTCVPSCSPPVCYPVGGLGSLNPCSISAAGGVSASSLGIAHGASVGCVSQTPPSELVIQPAPVIVAIPGPILSASCEPVRVGGFTACGGGSSNGGSSRVRCYPCIPCNPCRS